MKEGGGFVRIYLLALGAFSVLIGVAYLIWPIEITSSAGFVLSSPTAVIDVQGFYGGQLIGLGVAMLIGVWDRRFVVAALIVATASLGGTAAGRLYGVVAGGTCPPLIAGLFILELATAGVGAVLLKQEIAHAA